MADTVRYDRPEDLAGVRAHVRSCAQALGLSAHRSELLTVAVSELTTNTLQHTDGGGSVRVWAGTGQVVCDVIDGGPVRTFGAMPSADSVRGRGLAIVEYVADEVASTATEDGTLVRIRMYL